MSPNWRRAALLAAALAGCFCLPVQSAEPDRSPPPSSGGISVVPGVGGLASSPTPSSVVVPARPFTPGKLSLSVFFYPLVLVVLGGFAIYLMRSGWPGGFLRKSAPRKLQVAEIRPLGNRQFLVVAEYESTRLLLGVSQGRIDMLCHLSRSAQEPTDFASLIPEDPKP